VFNGESTNNDLGRAGRQTADLLDELASVENAEAVWKATGDTTNRHPLPPESPGPYLPW
jgi:hypothetical protein